MISRKKMPPRGEQQLPQSDRGSDSSADAPSKRTRTVPEAETTSDDIDVAVVQGGERRGWLRSNDRTMILALTFQHLSAEERRRWAAVLRGSQSDAGELELALRYEDRGVVEGKNRGKYPERVRLVKFDSSIKHSSDVVLLWENYLTLVSQNGVLSLKQEPKLTDLSDFFKVVDDRGKLCVKFKLTTNITSKSHDNRRFRFTSRARRGSSSDYLGKSLTGESFDFELVAKHRTQAASNATKSVQRTVAKVQAAAFEAPLPAEELPPLKLTSATSDGAPGDTVTCFGSENISDTGVVAEFTMVEGGRKRKRNTTLTRRCLLYTSDAADDLLCVDLGGRRIIKKKKKQILRSLV
eukprot:TRINITY_DN2543_c0_g1_i5.p1 TRINITY_DN2543_c0_g1~~TRINITY_DN2543_c0_g1_i5.p1  ORF type:complete len:352 (+),score=80.24 TRINITY_DN2543_c0_g1_i5:208-1263(+)